MAMGTNAAVELANLYVFYTIEHPFKRRIIAREMSKRGLNLDMNWFTRWHRFIDDIFLIWKDGYDQFLRFQEVLNALDPHIKFTFTCNAKSSVFLDLEIFKSNQQIAFRVYQKPMNRFLYIPWSSAHPIGAKKGFIIGELTRYARNCTFKLDFLRIRSDFKTRLQLRGYPNAFIETIFNKVTYENRGNRDNTQLNAPQPQELIFIPLRYHPIIQASQLQDRIQQYLDVIDPTQRAMISYSSNSNISQLATRTRF
jgi:hypothetical protein